MDDRFRCLGKTWATDGELENAIALFKHWGVLRKDLLVWNKTWPNGQRRMGMGFNFRRTCEFVLFGVRGKLRPGSLSARALKRR